MLKSDPVLTRQRRLALESYLRSALGHDKVFRCQSYEACKQSCSSKFFYVDQRPHIGDHYDLSVNDKPRRVVIIGQEYGSSDEFVSVNDRTQIIHDCGDYTFGQRNPHMRGTTSILRLLLGRSLGKDIEGEKLGIEDAHLFQGFSLINALMCSAINRAPNEESGFGSAQGRASDIMFQECARHLRAILQILEPTTIVVQGTNHRIVSAVGRALESNLAPGRQNVTSSTGDNIDVFVIPHPSAPGYGWWGRSDRSRYLTDEIAPLLVSGGGGTSRA